MRTRLSRIPRGVDSRHEATTPWDLFDLSGLRVSRSCAGQVAEVAPRRDEHARRSNVMTTRPRTPKRIARVARPASSPLAAASPLSQSCEDACMRSTSLPQAAFTLGTLADDARAARSPPRGACAVTLALPGARARRHDGPWPSDHGEHPGGGVHSGIFTAKVFTPTKMPPTTHFRCDRCRSVRRQGKQRANPTSRGVVLPTRKGGTTTTTDSGARQRARALLSWSPRAHAPRDDARPCARDVRANLVRFDVLPCGFIAF